MLDTAKFEFTKAVSTLDHLLADEYAVGDKFSIADILLAHTFNWAIRFELMFREIRGSQKPAL